MSSHTLPALVEALRRLPGVGQKTASRMAYHLLQHDREGAQLIAQALQQACAQVRHCSLCNTFTEGEVCDTCADPARDRSRLCVVETPADQAAVERTSAFKGLYYVLMGRLSPLDGVGPREIGLARPLPCRVRSHTSGKRCVRLDAHGTIHDRDPWHRADDGAEWCGGQPDPWP